MGEESGPNLGGRPAIGPRVPVAIPDNAIAQVDAYAKALGASRAAAPLPALSIPVGWGRWDERQRKAL